MGCSILYLMFSTKNFYLQCAGSNCIRCCTRSFNMSFTFKCVLREHRWSSFKSLNGGGYILEVVPPEINSWLSLFGVANHIPKKMLLCTLLASISSLSGNQPLSSTQTTLSTATSLYCVRMWKISLMLESLPNADACSWWRERRVACLWQRNSTRALSAAAELRWVASPPPGNRGM